MPVAHQPPGDPPEMFDPLIGQTLGHPELQDRLGRGGGLPHGLL